MRERVRLTRRALMLSGVSGGFLAAAGVRLTWDGSPACEAAVRRVLGAVSADWRGARLVGRAYVEGEGLIDASLEHLLALMFPSSQLSDTVKLSAGDIRAMISERVRRDFSAGAVVSVDGWLLALTEARLYALAWRLGDWGRGATDA